MKRVSRKRAVILARKYDRIADSLRVDLEPGFTNRPQAPDQARACVARAANLLAEAYCLLNDYGRGRI